MLQSATFWKKCVRYWGLVAMPGAALLLAGSSALAEQPSEEIFSPTTAISLPAGQTLTSFDLSFVDPVLELYFLSDRTRAC